VTVAKTKLDAEAELDSDGELDSNGELDAACEGEVHAVESCTRGRAEEGTEESCRRGVN